MEEQMIERVARAIAAVDGIELGRGLEDWEPWLKRARAAIEAMQEPTMMMLKAGLNHAGAASLPDDVYPPMIRAALR